MSNTATFTTVKNNEKEWIVKRMINITFTLKSKRRTNPTIV